ncbi:MULTISPECIES: arsenate reductase (glutaredoxin) [Marinobacter]|jgi:arsenate reductase|uniref:Arsenate reductase n=2 Tax=Marinobacter TaxID=2742 RepID=A0A5M3PSF2_9GAMM|nr:MULTISPECIES: arsenate reductase (glutaredoxin) [Marinobacter]MBO6811655.1 arsenate reductase (glutaredoxin) [Marinobacter sp.]MBO6875234.1 arsenate reductase (glutaredoxin) [Marinobacter sp.]MBY6069685.1 arsenate reductase (glutaredoxin) [Marinobacter salsuginis]ODM29536.1 arsenate reductase (glutaredoxin) [Marinobacter adhaerens]GBO85850.1 arsenate reductase [Marinobacter salsuginis]|tara:strand:- start:2063 stop:2416 length:354 start_codon:yes stop_codon:yes gene_type:complete
MTEPTRIFHNPRCSKSRQTLELLTERGIEPEIIRYLETPPTEQELKDILSALNLTPRELMRTKEKEYKEQGLNNPELSDEQLIAAMIATPKLIERPIVIANGKVALGRPPENVLSIL